MKFGKVCDLSRRSEIEGVDTNEIASNSFPFLLDIFKKSFSDHQKSMVAGASRNEHNKILSSESGSIERVGLHRRSASLRSGWFRRGHLLEFNAS